VTEWSLLLAVGIVGVLVGRAQVLDVLAPFGLAYVAACFAWKRDIAACALLGIVVGRGWLMGIEAAAIEAAMGVVFWLSAELAIGGKTAEVSPSRIVCAAVGACAAVRGITALQGGGSPYDLFLLIFEVLLVASSTVVLFTGVPQLFLRGFCVGEVDDFTAVAAAAISGALLLLGTRGFQLAGLHVSWVMAVATVFLFSSGGLWGGIGAGAAVGVTFGLAAEFDPTLAILLAASGASAGLLSQFGWWAAVVGFSVIFVMFGIISDSLILPGPWEMLIALGLYLLYPLSPKAPAAAEIAATADPGPAEDRRGRIRGLFDRLQESSRRRDSHDQTAAPEKLVSFARAFRRVAESFSEGSETDDDIVIRRDRTAQLVEEIGRRVCGTCDSYSECWQNQFLGTYHLLSELLACFEMAGERSLEKRCSELRQRCGSRTDEVLEVARYTWQIQRMGIKWASQFAEARDLAATQLRGLADIMEDFAANGEGDRHQNASNGRRLCYQAGVAQVAQGGSGSSGDSHLIRRLGGTELVVLLSDGMGSGDRARRESRAALSLLEELMQLGLDRGVALRTVNSVLLLRSSEDTCATVDMMSLDLVRGEAEFTKIGAAPTFIKRSGEVISIPSQSVPIGILDELALDTTQMCLDDGDLVVMVTDGVMDALGSLTETDKTRWIRRFLRSERFDDPEDLATSLVARTASLCPDGFPDDMSAIAIELRDRT